MVQNISKAQFLALDSKQFNKTDDRFVPKAYKDVASGMEKVFAQMMLEHMERATDQTEEDGPAQKFYKSLQLEQRADAMTEQGGTGLGVQQMILDQIYPKELRTEANYQAFEQQEKARMPYKKALEMYNKNKNNDIISIGPKQDAVANNGIQGYRQEDSHE